MTDSDEGNGKQSAEVIGLDRRQLLTRHVNGDPKAFGELVSLYQRQVYTYLIRCGIEASTRDDLFQDVFLKVHNSASSYQPEKPLNPWLFVIVANTVRSHYRKQKVRRFASEELVKSERDETEDVSDVIEAKETAEWLEAQIQQLPFKQREVIVMCSIGDLNQGEVAQILNIPPATVRTLLRRARLTLATSLAKRKAKLSREVSS